MKTFYELLSEFTEYKGHEDRFDKLHPVIRDGKCDGRTVGSSIPNTASIQSSLEDYQVLPGVRQVSMSHFPHASARNEYYDAKDHDRVRELAKNIDRSKHIEPLIVVHDHEGPYVLEGGHRLCALHHLGAKAFPAKVVIDRSEIRHPAYDYVDGVLKHRNNSEARRVLEMKTLSAECLSCHQNVDSENAHEARDHEGKSGHICTDCKNNGDWNICQSCESRYDRMDGANHCAHCLKKDKRHEVRIDDSDKNQFFSTKQAAHNFAKKNSYQGRANVYHRGEHQQSYWQGK